MSRVLAAPEARAWSDAAGRALRALRLNKHFPPWRRLAAHLAAMADPGSTSAGKVRLDQSSGLPVPREWIRVRMDQELASQTLAAFADVDVNVLPAVDASRMRAKRAYLERLVALDPLPTRSVAVQLRHLEGNRASYLVVVDRFDLASATVARYTLLVEDTPGRRVSPGELALQATEDFARALEVLSTQDAALAFAALRGAGLVVTEVVRGVVGPAALGPTQEGCGPAPILGFAGAGPVITAALERASLDLSAGRVDDPLAQQVTIPAADVDFGLSWQRKWAVPRPAVEALRGWLVEKGSRNLVYGY